MIMQRKINVRKYDVSLVKYYSIYFSGRNTGTHKREVRREILIFTYDNHSFQLLEQDSRSG